MNRFGVLEQRESALLSSVPDAGCDSWRSLAGEAEDRWDPKLLKFHRYWKSIHPADGLPGRQHVDATDIPDLLANTWLIDVEYLPQGCRFRYRLMGTLIVKAAERELTGAYIDAVEGPLSPKLRRYKQMLATRQPTYRKGSAIPARAAALGTEEIVVPLARDGRNVDMMMGCAVFFPLLREPLPNALAAR